MLPSAGKRFFLGDEEGEWAPEEASELVKVFEHESTPHEDEIAECIVALIEEALHEHAHRAQEGPRNALS